MKRFLRRVVVVGAGAAGATYLIRRRRRDAVSVALYYADGSLVALSPESPDALELRALAGDVRRVFEAGAR